MQSLELWEFCLFYSPSHLFVTKNRPNPYHLKDIYHRLRQHFETLVASILQRPLLKMEYHLFFTTEVVFFSERFEMSLHQQEI
jgi:hypothetical protein